nr:MAG TPA: hypothetical protein [Caudoviricetes sp.]
MDILPSFDLVRLMTRRLIFRSTVSFSPMASGLPESVSASNK